MYSLDQILSVAQMRRQLQREYTGDSEQDAADEEVLVDLRAQAMAWLERVLGCPPQGDTAWTVGTLCSLSIATGPLQFIAWQLIELAQIAYWQPGDGDTPTGEVSTRGLQILKDQYGYGIHAILPPAGGWPLNRRGWDGPGRLRYDQFCVQYERGLAEKHLPLMRRCLLLVVADFAIGHPTPNRTAERLALSLPRPPRLPVEPDPLLARYPGVRH